MRSRQFTPTIISISPTSSTKNQRWSFACEATFRYLSVLIVDCSYEADIKYEIIGCTVSPGHDFELPGEEESVIQARRALGRFALATSLMSDLSAQQNYLWWSPHGPGQTTKCESQPKGRVNAMKGSRHAEGSTR